MLDSDHPYIKLKALGLEPLEYYFTKFNFPIVRQGSFDLDDKS